MSTPKEEMFARWFMLVNSGLAIAYVSLVTANISRHIVFQLGCDEYSCEAIPSIVAGLVGGAAGAWCMKQEMETRMPKDKEEN